MVTAAVNTSIHIELSAADVAAVQRLADRLQQVLDTAPNVDDATVQVWVHQPPATPARRWLMDLTGGPVYRPLATVLRGAL